MLVPRSIRTALALPPVFRSENCHQFYRVSILSIGDCDIHVESTHFDVSLDTTSKKKGGGQGAFLS